MGGLVAKKPEGGGDYEPTEAGNHHGICYRYFDLGTQHSELFNKDIHKVLIIWELPELRIEYEGENKPRVISNEYSLSLHKKSNLRKDLESWRGKPFTDKELEGFNLDKILGVNGIINIIHNTKDDRTYANVASIGPLMINMKRKKPENEIFGWSFTNDGPDQLPKDTPEWIRNKIEVSLEWKSYSQDKTGIYEPETQDPNVEEGDPGWQAEDDIPF